MVNRQIARAFENFCLLKCDSFQRTEVRRSPIPQALGYVWRKHDHLKGLFICTRLHRVTSRKVAFIVVITVRISDLNQNKKLFLVTDQRDAQIFFYVFISTYNALNVSSTSCSSSGETNCINTASGNSHSMLVAEMCAGWKKIPSNLHKSRPPTQNDCYQKLY